MMDQTPTPDQIRRRMNAMSFWMLQVFSIMAGDRPGEMAAWVRMRATLLKQLTPPDDGSIAPADYDKLLLELTPDVEALGDYIAKDLETYQRLMDAGEATPTFRILPTRPID